MKSCLKCKAIVRDIDKFCYECGSNVKRDRLLMWLFTILIIISLAVVGLVLSNAFFNNDNSTNSVNFIITSVVTDTNCKKCKEYDNKCVGNDYYYCENIGNNCYDWVVYPNWCYNGVREPNNPNCKKCSIYDVKKCVGNDLRSCESVGNYCYDWKILENNDKCITKTTSDSDCKKCSKGQRKCVGNDFWSCGSVGNNCYDWVVYTYNNGCITKETRLELNSVPVGATVYLNGKPVGITPYKTSKSLPLDASYYIRLSKEGYNDYCEFGRYINNNYNEKLDITLDEQTNCDNIVNLNDDEIIFTSEPCGAVISIGDNIKGKTPFKINLKDITDYKYSSFSISSSSCYDSYNNFIKVGLDGSVEIGAYGSNGKYIKKENNIHHFILDKSYWYLEQK